MKKIIAGLALIGSLISCKNNKAIVDVGFADSLINQYKPAEAVKTNAGEIEFWKNRIDPKQPGLVNELKYAGALAARFHLEGDIKDLKTADSMLLLVDSVFNYKESSPELSLARHCMLEHRFRDARAYFLKATALSLKPYEYYSTSFDVNLELGYYADAKRDLEAIKQENDYGYQFRLSKWEHLNGNLENAVAAMTKATALSGNNDYIKQAAISNTADLYLHEGELQKAYDLYIQSLRISAADLHSIMGLGWIALVHDHNDALAEKIFRYVQTKTQAPDPLLKMVHVAEAMNDTAMQKRYAEAFEKKVTDTAYGNMYNKYMIDLYTSELNNPAAAEALSKRELGNRTTPQTYSWYAYSLFKNNKGNEALSIYKQYVSGKPLEALELYWMGKMMQGLHKNYNALGFFKAAYKNRYDLSPAKLKDLESIPGVR